MPVNFRSRQEILKRQPVDNDNLIQGWWPLENDAGDISGNENMGSFVGSPPLILGPARAQGLGLNGSTQEVTTITNFGNASSIQTISLMGWFQTSTASGISFVMFNQSQDGSSGTADRGLYIGTDGKVYAYVFDATGASPKVAVSSATYIDGNWHHAVLTLAPSDSIKLYVDGIFQQSTSVSTPYTGYTSSFLVMGRNGAISGANSASGFFIGNIADIKFYRRVVSPGEVFAEYNRMFASKPLSPDEWEIPALSTGLPPPGPILGILGFADTNVNY